MTPRCEHPTLPDTGYPLDVPGVYELRGVLPPIHGAGGRGAALGHNRSSSIPTVRCATRFRSCAPSITSLPSLGVSAALRVAGIRPQDVRLDGTRLLYGDRVMPLSRRAGQGARTARRLPVGSDQLPRAGAARRPEEPYLSDLFVLRSALLRGADPRRIRSRRSIRRSSATRSCSSASLRAGLFDVFETPFSNGKMPGVQIHAAVADDILSNRFIRQAARPASRRDRRRRGARRSAWSRRCCRRGGRRLRRSCSSPACRGSRRGCSPVATG